MKHINLSRVVGLALVIGALLAPAAVAQTPDVWITLKAKIALLTTEDVGAMDLNVDTVGGVVTLHGKVATNAEKTKAESVTRTVDGVKDVQNLLQVVPAAKRETIDAKDDQIQADLKSAFAQDAALAKSGISVSSVNNGVVLLSGRAPSHEVHLKAIETAYRVKGVKRVATEVEVPIS